jgi:hypothetical protein
MSKNNTLRKIAALLPDLPLYKKGAAGQKVIQTSTPKIILTGKEWKKMDPLAKTKDKKVPDDNTKYVLSFAPQTLNINHFPELQKTYKTEGAPGILKYIDIVYTFNKETPPDLITDLVNKLIVKP